MNIYSIFQAAKQLLIVFIVCLCLTACPGGGGDNPPTPSAGTAKLSVDPNTLDFGKASSEVSFKVKNTGDAALTWTATADKNWLTITPASGSVAAGSETTIKVAVDRSKLGAGENTTTVTVSAKQGDTALGSGTVEVKALKP